MKVAWIIMMRYYISKQSRDNLDRNIYVKYLKIVQIS
jgi:hypothetical protein